MTHDPNFPTLISSDIGLLCSVPRETEEECHEEEVDHGAISIALAKSGKVPMPIGNDEEDLYTPAGLQPVNGKPLDTDYLDVARDYDYAQDAAARPIPGGKTAWVPEANPSDLPTTRYETGNPRAPLENQ